MTARCRDSLHIPGNSSCGRAYAQQPLPSVREGAVADERGANARLASNDLTDRHGTPRIRNTIGSAVRWPTIRLDPRPLSLTIQDLYDHGGAASERHHRRAVSSHGKQGSEILGGALPPGETSTSRRQARVTCKTRAHPHATDAVHRGAGRAQASGFRNTSRAWPPASSTP